MNEKPSDMGPPGRYSVLGSIMVGSILGPIDASIVNIVLPTITQFFELIVMVAVLSSDRWTGMLLTSPLDDSLHSVIESSESSRLLLILGRNLLYSEVMDDAL